MRNLRTSCAVAICVAAGATSASAATPDRAICAVQQAISCTATEPCDRALPAAVNLPVLLKIDLGEGVITSRLQSGDQRRSDIASQSGDDTHHVIQGIDGGAAWSMRIDLSTGNFTVASAHADVGYTAFGVCSSSLLD